MRDLWGLSPKGETASCKVHLGLGLKLRLWLGLGFRVRVGFEVKDWG